jgi:hypothetical protein
MFEVGKVENARSGQKNKLNRAEEENLSPQSRAILEKLIVPQLVKKFSLFYRTERFITAFTVARHLFLS